MPAGLPPDDGGEGGFLSRWSRLKRRPDAPADSVPTLPAVEPGAPVVVVPEAAPEDASPTAQPDPVDEERQRILASLPSLESITATTDVTGFMHHLVPHALRNAALRAAWSADPAIRDFVNDARDYALDYNTPGMAPGYGPLTESDDIQTMIGQIFGRPVDKSLAFLPEEPVEERVAPCGSESQSDVSTADAAMQQGTLPAPELVSVRRSDQSDTVTDFAEIAEGSTAGRALPSDAALQQTAAEGDGRVPAVQPPRRRGGRATPA